MNTKYYVVFDDANDEMQYGNEFSRDEIFKLKKNKLVNILSVTESSKVK
jgi:hypothetical protein